MPERETKLSPPPAFRLPSLDHVADTTRAVPRDPVLLRATYYDTDDLRLARAGASLRYRNDDGWTVKLPVTTVDGLLVRGEHHVDGDPGAPPDGALDLVRAFVRTAPISPVARLRTRRATVDIVDGDGKPQVEVVDDEVSVLDGRRVASRFRELEVEIAESTPEEVASAVVDRLRAAGAGDPDPVPKVVRALGVRALDPPDVPAPGPLSRDDPAGDVVRAAIASSVRRLLANDAGVRLGDDPEPVHQARVATRRLRSDLRTFRSLIEPEWAGALRDELKWLAAELGAVRDTEVLIELLRGKVTRLAARDQRAADHVVARLVARWEDERIELLSAMRSARYEQLLERLVDAVREPALLEPAAMRAGDVLAPLVAGPWAHLRRAVETLEPEPADDALHQVRIRAKRCRYAAEAVAPVVGKPAVKFARRLAALQDVLGDHHDAVVAVTWLHEVASDAQDVEAFAAGELAALELADEQTTRAAWRGAWKAASRKQLRRWW